MPRGPEPGPLLRSMVPGPADIEPLSQERIAAEAGEIPWIGDERQMAIRIAYAVGDATVLRDFACSAGAVAAGVAALRAGAPIVTDVRMVAVGIDRDRAGRLGVDILTAIDDPQVAADAASRGITRSAQAMLSLGERLDGAVVAIGNAPTALLALLDMVDAGLVRPAVILGFPVGYVAASESKEELLGRPAPYVTVRGKRGGTPMTVSAVNTLLRLAAPGERPVAARGDSAAGEAPRPAPGEDGTAGPRIRIIGVGDDGLAGLGEAARRAVAGARTLYGGARHLAMVPEHRGRRVDLGRDYQGALSELLSGSCGEGAVVLASGDPMLFGIGSALSARLGDAASERLDVLPAASSVQHALAALGIPADGVTVLSALARPVAPLLARAMPLERFAVLLDPAHSAQVVAQALLAAGMEDASAAVGERLGGPNARITRGTLSSVAEGQFDRLSLLVVQRAPGVARGYRRSGIPESEFAHRAGLITKAEPRALAIAALALEPGSVLWDVGAGSGSVAIEAGLGMPEGAVYAVDRDPEQVAFIRANRVRFRTPQVEAVEGAAPAALADLPEPDAVFIGGGGADLPAILETVMARLRPGGRLALTLITVERLGPALEALRAWSPRLRQIGVAHGASIGDGTRLVPANPVLLVTATKPADSRSA